MSHFDFIETSLPDLILIQRKLVKDQRGFFSRFFCADELASLGIKNMPIQINHTLTSYAGTVRGLHFQYPPHSEIKIVNCLKGEIFDVAVDLRRNSKTFLQWHAEILSAGNSRSLLIPEGFAHGFQALCDDCELIYLHSSPYNPHAEGALNVSDPYLQISWPLAITNLSKRDRSHPYLDDRFEGLVL